MHVTLFNANYPPKLPLHAQDPKCSAAMRMRDHGSVVAVLVIGEEATHASTQESACPQGPGTAEWGESAGVELKVGVLCSPSIHTPPKEIK